MADIYLRHAFASSNSGGPSARASATRFALALTVSVLLHAWLVAGIVPERAGRSLPPVARPLTAQLQPRAAAPESKALPEREPVPADPEQAVPTRSHLEPPAEREPTSATQPSRVAPPAFATADPALSQVLPVPQADDTYYAAPDLDVYPMPQLPLRFEYPKRAARERLGGRVSAMLSLSESGIVDDVAIVAGEPPGYFEDVVRAALRASHFTPARKDGRDVRSRILIKVDFDPHAAEGAQP